MGSRSDWNPHHFHGSPGLARRLLRKLQVLEQRKGRIIGVELHRQFTLSAFLFSETVLIEPSATGAPGCEPRVGNSLWADFFSASTPAGDSFWYKDWMECCFVSLTSTSLNLPKLNPAPFAGFHSSTRLHSDRPHYAPRKQHAGRRHLHAFGNGEGHASSAHVSKLHARIVGIPVHPENRCFRPHC